MLIVVLSPISRGVAGNVIEGSSDVREVLDESAVKVYKANKLLHFLLRLWHQPPGHSSYLDWVHFYLAVRDDESEVFYVGTFEVAFVMSEEKLVFSEDVQDLSDDLAVFFQVLGEDEDVIDAVIDKILEDVIHHGLEGGWAVSNTIQHYQQLKEPLVTLKGHFPFVAFLDLDVLVAPLDIKFGEVFGTADSDASSLMCTANTKTNTRCE
jgi:hypothetical protein